MALLLPVAAGAQDEPPRVLRVVTTTTDLRAIAAAVGGERVTAVALARGTEDPHTVIARPSLMAEVRDADLFVEVGLGLELWAEPVLDGAGNPRVRRGAPGHVYASRGLEILDRPAVATRAEGDIHPEGNPHVWLDPVRAKGIGRNIAAGLARVDRGRAATYEAGAKGFGASLDEALYGPRLLEAFGGRSDVLERLLLSGKIEGFLAGRKFRDEPLAGRLGGWLARAAPLRGKALVFYHQSWPYLAERFGFRIAGHVEEKPGIPPSARHRDLLVATIREAGVRVIGVESFRSTAFADEIAAAAGGGVRVVPLPLHVGGVAGTDTYPALLDSILGRLAEAVVRPDRADGGGGPEGGGGGPEGGGGGPEGGGGERG